PALLCNLTRGIQQGNGGAVLVVCELGDAVVTEMDRDVTHPERSKHTNHIGRRLAVVQGTRVRSEKDLQRAVVSAEAVDVWMVMEQRGVLMVQLLTIVGSNREMKYGTWRAITQPLGE